MLIRYATIIFAAAVLAATAAAGVSAVEPERAEAQKAAAPDTVSVKTCTGGALDLTTDEKRMLDLHNKARADNNLPAFCVDSTLTRAARAHSQEVLDKDYFAHNSFNGETFSARLKRAGYAYRTAGENIAWGSGPLSTPENRFKGWMDSSGHKANILNKNFREIRIGARTGAYTDRKTGKTYNGAAMWTADFGTWR